MNEIYHAIHVVKQNELERFFDNPGHEEQIKKRLVYSIADEMLRTGVVDIKNNDKSLRYEIEFMAEVAILKVEELYRLKQIEKMFNMLQEGILAEKIKFRLDDLCNTEAAIHDAD